MGKIMLRVLLVFFCLFYLLFSVLSVNAQVVDFPFDFDSGDGFNVQDNYLNYLNVEPVGDLVGDGNVYSSGWGGTVNIIPSSDVGLVFDSNVVSHVEVNGQTYLSGTKWLSSGSDYEIVWTYDLSQTVDYPTPTPSPSNHSVPVIYMLLLVLGACIAVFVGVFKMTEDSDHRGVALLLAIICIIVFIIFMFAFLQFGGFGLGSVVNNGISTVSNVNAYLPTPSVVPTPTPNPTNAPPTPTPEPEYGDGYGIYVQSGTGLTDSIANQIEGYGMSYVYMQVGEWLADNSISYTVPENFVSNINNAHNNNLRILAWVTAQDYEPDLSTSGGRAVMVAELEDLLDTYDFDGVYDDIEEFNGNFGNLITFFNAADDLVNTKPSFMGGSCEYYTTVQAHWCSDEDIGAVNMASLDVDRLGLMMYSNWALTGDPSEAETKYKAGLDYCVDNCPSPFVYIVHSDLYSPYQDMDVTCTWMDEQFVVSGGVGEFVAVDIFWNYGMDSGQWSYFTTKFGL